MLSSTHQISLMNGMERAQTIPVANIGRPHCVISLLCLSPSVSHATERSEYEKESFATVQILGWLGPTACTACKSQTDTCVCVGKGGCLVRDNEMKVHTIRLVLSAIANNDAHIINDGC